jgi:subtilisin family serine protease
MKWLALIALFIAVASAIIIDQDIYEAFEKNEPADVFIHMPMYEPKIMSYKLTKVRSESRVLARKARAVHNAAFQPKMEAFLREQGFDFKTFWIVNSILVKSATPALIAKLQTFPEVVELELDKVTAYIVDPMVHEVEANSVRTQDLRAEWNVNIINAPQAWGVTRGEGITVSNIDTGILHTHVALTGSYRGTLTNGSYDHHYNWFDPRGQQTPFDNNGHGTHTMGTLAGSEASGVGVAPNSKFIAAKGCASSSCATADLLASAEWVICPTRQGGTGEDCTKGADLVSNSWGGGRGSSTYKTVIEAWLDAGSVPLFSQGNSGSACSTANSPGDLGIVIGVGSTDSNDALSSFSSRGPGIGTVDHPLQKPDISAPGEAVRSAYPTSNNAYATLSGTSMACPAVAGVTALVMSANENLGPEEIRDILTSTADQGVSPPKGGQTTCSGRAWNSFPSYHYGWGRVDAFAAVSEALNRK